MTLAAYASTGFVVAAIHAWHLRRGHVPAFHRPALGIALAVGVPAALLQPLSGDFAAKMVARNQPAKLAALEGQFVTERSAPLRIGGWPAMDARETRFAIEIPGALSFLAFGDFGAEVKGLDQVPRADWPPVPVVHVAFQVMLGMGLCMVLVSLGVLWRVVRRRPVEGSPLLLSGIIAAGPMGFIATEAGWVVTEVGRQPWVIQDVLRTTDAVTPMPGLIVPFTLFTVLYLFLAAIVVSLLARQFSMVPRSVRHTAERLATGAVDKTSPEGEL
jgi:cytochrome d ubiquinol oxidase subunit I